MRYKKFWILHDGEERIEESAKDKEGLTGEISCGHYPDGIIMVGGTYIVFPANEDVEPYRKKLISYLIEEEASVIFKAQRKIHRLVKKL